MIGFVARPRRRSRRALSGDAASTSLRSLLAAEELLAAARRTMLPSRLPPIEDGVDVNERSTDGTTALHWAVYNGNAALVERLIAAGADAAVTNEFGFDAACGSCDGRQCRHHRGAARGRRRGQRAGRETALMVVARSGNTAAAQALLERGADVNARELWREQTALMWAAAQNQPEMVQLLIERGADVDARSVVNEWPRQVTGEPRRRVPAFRRVDAAAVRGPRRPPRVRARAGRGRGQPRLAGPEGRDTAVPCDRQLSFRHGEDPHRSRRQSEQVGLVGPLALLHHDVNTAAARRARRPPLPSTQRRALEFIELLLEAGAWPNVQLKLLPPYRHIGDDRGCDIMLVTGTTPLLRAAKTFDTAAIDTARARRERRLCRTTAASRPSWRRPASAPSSAMPAATAPAFPTTSRPTTEQRSDRRAEAAARRRREHSTRARCPAAPGARSAGRTALFGAAFWGWNDVVDYLVERGAKIGVAERAGLDARRRGHGPAPAATAAARRSKCTRTPRRGSASSASNKKAAI